MGMLVLSAVVAASLQAGNTYTLELSHETRERDQLLFVPAPWPANRVDDPRREELGRIWYSRTPVGNRSPLAEQVYVMPGAAAYGASPEHIDDLIEVRADVVPIIISPWEEINDVDEHYLRRYRPWIKPTEREQMIAEMRRAQHLWLKEQGYLGGVRTHVNPARPVTGQAASDPVRPRAVIRLRPEVDEVPLNVSLPPRNGVTRVSLPDYARPHGATVVVEREQSQSQPESVSAKDIVEEQDASAS
ncbi:MAG: hypothetical protein KDA21_15190 [Phycisphaerales bacterium]|nr:hypothetical protein [Phycisphaerales bacterium]